MPSSLEDIIKVSQGHLPGSDAPTSPPELLSMGRNVHYVSLAISFCQQILLSEFFLVKCAEHFFS